MFGSSTEALTTISELSGAKGSSGDRTIDQVWRVVVKQIMWAWGDDEAAEDSLNEEMMYFFEDDELEDFMNKLIAEQGTGWELKCLLLALASTQILTDLWMKIIRESARTIWQKIQFIQSRCSEEDLECLQICSRRSCQMWKRMIHSFNKNVMQLVKWGPVLSRRQQLRWENWHMDSLQML
eukprot:TRINITY_DN9155_c0_g1_i5.p1 TRINITY_DN9155_c0_g1~~TRINITY_DN9155_c0_g1_i5.p1  ORF type:complete len:181 (-),score=20.59 TRINITY_DN9155_c0_g1_i5:63-605(-)